jgi:hypothetical protein
MATLTSSLSAWLEDRVIAMHLNVNARRQMH